MLLKRWPSALAPGERLVATIGGGMVLPTTLLEGLLTITPPFSLGAVGLVLLAAVVPGVLSCGAYSVLQRQSWVHHARR